MIFIFISNLWNLRVTFLYYFQPEFNTENWF